MTPRHLVSSMGPARMRVAAPLLTRAEPHIEPECLTKAQQAVVTASSTSALCVLGGPATGKTTALVASVVAQVRAGVALSRLVVLTGSRPAAQQLRARIIATVGSTQRGLQVTTVHGWCQQLLHRFADAEHPAPRLLSAPEQEFRVRELLAGLDHSRWPERLWSALGTRGFAREIRAILARARQLGFDPDDLAFAGRAAGRPEWVAVAGFFNEYLDVLDAEGVIDYAELVHRARLLLQEERVRARLPEIASMIFCDEFADLDRGMINVLADAHRAGSAVVAFADPDTAVFGFRGADPHAVVDFAERFDRPGAPALTLALEDNLRSVPQVVEALQMVSSRLPYRGVVHPPATRVGSRHEHAAVQVGLVTDAASQAQQIAEVLRQAHLGRGIGWAQMAVITRSGQNAVTELARRLAAAGVPVQVVGDEVALADELAVRHLLAVLSAAVHLREASTLEERQAARLLRTPLGGMDALALRRLGRELRHLAKLADPQSLPVGSGRLIADELSGVGLVADDLPEGQAADHTEPELQALRRMRQLLGGLVSLLEQEADLPTLLWYAWSKTSWPQRLQAEALSGSESSPRAHRDLDAVVALFDLAARGTNWAGVKGVRTLVAEVEGRQIPADTARENDPRRSGVAVLTVHRSKGEQWRLVVLAGLQEGQWPALGDAGGLLRADLLAPDGLQPPPGPAEQLAAERRALLLAASRASEQLVVIGIDDPSGETDPPSRFLGEFGVPVQPVSGGESPSTLGGLVGQLRRVAGDPACEPGLRQQASAELAWLGEQTDADGRPLVAGCDPDDWWGLREVSRSERPVAEADQPIRLGGSEVQQLLTCPRQWFLDKRARGQQAWGVDAAFGTLVHSLIAEATKRGVRASGLVDELDTIWPRLAYGAQWVGLAEREAVEATLARFDRWASSLDHGRVLGVEVRFEVPISVGGQEITMVGTVDRLEADEQNRLRVIDFKTGRSPVSVGEAAVMDQLGIYQLAARLGAFDELSGGLRELADAQVVYLRAGSGQDPTLRSQPSLDQVPLVDGEPVSAGPTWVHDRLFQAATIIRSEQFHARVNPGCKSCLFRLGCPAQMVGGEQ